MSIDTTSPIPQGMYLPAKRHGSLIFTSGMTPRREGVLTASGRVQSSQPLDAYRDAVILAAANALVAARNLLATSETLAGVLSMNVFVVAEPGFDAHSRLADFASGYLRDELGNEGIGARAAIGVASLPANAFVEIQMVVVAGGA